MQYILGKIKKTAINTVGRSMCVFYILQLKCIKKDRYHSEIPNLLTSIYIYIPLPFHGGTSMPALCKLCSVMRDRKEEDTTIWGCVGSHSSQPWHPPFWGTDTVLCSPCLAITPPPPCLLI